MWVSENYSDIEFPINMQVVELVEMQSGGHAEVAGNASWWGKASSEPAYPSLLEK